MEEGEGDVMVVERASEEMVEDEVTRGEVEEILDEAEGGITDLIGAKNLNPTNLKRLSKPI